MSLVNDLFTSSVGRKFTMAGTGLFLISFLVVHCGINALIFFNDGGEAFNKAAHFMGTNLIVRTMELGLFAFLLLHIVQGLALWRKNMKSRPSRYESYKSASTRPFYASSMGLLGTLILLFLILHLRNFWVPSRFGGLAAVFYDNVEYHNIYLEMVEHFQVWWVVLIYILGVISLFLHLLHGFQSAFQTFGWNNLRFGTSIRNAGWVYSVIICLLFAAMPLAMFLGFVK